MHLHSLEAKASEPGLMKRNPSNWLDFNANEREWETEREGEREREKWDGRGKKKKAVGTFLSSSVALHKTKIGNICTSHGGCRWLTLMQREHTEGGASPDKVTSRKHFHAIIRVMFHWSRLILLFSAACLSATLGDERQLRIFGRYVGASFCYDGIAATALLELWWATRRWLEVDIIEQSPGEGCVYVCVCVLGWEKRDIPRERRRRIRREKEWSRCCT